MRFILLLALILIVNQSLFAQHYKGVICDSITKKPLQNVELFTSSENTLTNENGSFEIKTAQKYVFVKTVFMDAPKVFDMKRFKPNDTLYLSPHIQLNEVVVTAQIPILKKVVKNLSKNYNTSTSYKTQMFTHSNLLVNGEPQLFLELVSENVLNFEIGDEDSKGFFGKSLKAKINILGLRKTVANKTATPYKNSLFTRNIVDWGIDPLNFLEKGTTKIEEFDSYYVLHYEYSRGITKFSGWFSVNKKDYAIIENYEKKEVLMSKEWLLKYNWPKTEISHIFYDKKEGFPYYTRKLLLVHQKFLAQNKVTSAIDEVELNFKMYNYQPTFNDLNISKPINNTYQKYVYEVEYPYQEEFWKKYNVPTSSFTSSELYQKLNGLKE